jgi:hypothetical protein
MDKKSPTTKAISKSILHLTMKLLTKVGMRPRSRCRCRFRLANRIKERRRNEAYFMHERRPVRRDGLDRDAVQNIEQLAGDGLAVLLHPAFVEAAVHGQEQLVAVLLDDEANKLLHN